jgi:hypothetical protein
VEQNINPLFGKVEQNIKSTFWKSGAKYKNNV